jgi:hypothetical protein
VLTAVRVRRRNDGVGGAAELLGVRLATADVHDERQVRQLLRAAILVQVPAGEHVVVALELVDVLRR